MPTTTELEQQLSAITDRYKKDVQGLRDRIEAFNNKQFPQLNDIVWFVGFDGKPYRFVWCKGYVDLGQERYFRTKADCAMYTKVQKVALMLLGDWVADWGDFDQEKFSLCYTHTDKQFQHKRSFSYQAQGALYMPEDAAEALNKEFTTNELRTWAGV